MGWRKVNALTFAAHAAALVVLPAAFCGAVAFAAIAQLAKWVERTHPGLEHQLADEIASWLATQETAL